VGQKDGKIVGVDQRVLGRTAHDILGMVDEILVERGLAGHQEGGALGTAAASAARLLPSAGDRARVAAHDADRHPANVHAQFQCIGGYHHPYRAVAQPSLDRAPLAGKVSSAVAAHDLGVQTKPLSLLPQRS